MSADNGIYILETIKNDGFEYRVVETSAIDNYRYTFCIKHGIFGFDENCIECHNLTETEDPDIWIQNARVIWKNSPVFSTHELAMQKALEIERVILSDDFCPILEYGICDIKIPRSF